MKWIKYHFFFTILQKSIVLFAFITGVQCLIFSTPLSAQIIYVNQTAIGNADGSSWENAFTDLQDALAATVYGDEIWVAQGTYRPTALFDRNISFELKNGVGIYGGFTGVETELSQRNPELNPTVLSGDIGVTGDSTDNSYTVVLVTEADPTTVLDGFTISGGNADSQFGPSSAPGKSGGAIYFLPSPQVGEIRLKLLNCVFGSNYAKSFGGAIYMKSNNDVAVTPFFQSCVFSDNLSNNGGAIYKSGNSLMDDMLLSDCVFEGNSATQGGGVYYATGFGSKNFHFDNCVFKKNGCFVSGGVLYQEGENIASQIIFSNSLFKENYNEGGGNGAIMELINYSLAQSLVLTNCSFVDHQDENSAGLISLLDCVPDIEGCVFLNNIQSVNLCFEYVTILNHGIPFLIKNSLFINNKAEYGGAIGLFSEEVQFINCLLLNNEGLSMIRSPNGEVSVEITNSILNN